MYCNGSTLDHLRRCPLCLGARIDLRLNFANSFAPDLSFVRSFGVDQGIARRVDEGDGNRIVRTSRLHDRI